MASFAENRQAKFNFEFLEKFTAGIELSGLEVKSIKTGHLSLSGAYVTIRGNEAFLMNSNLEPFQPKNTPDSYDAQRPKKLLLTKKELEILRKAEDTKGLTIVPISVYNKGRFLKVDVAIARGKKKFDKRETIKKRDTERDLKRSL